MGHVGKVNSSVRALFFSVFGSGSMDEASHSYGSYLSGTARPREVAFRPYLVQRKEARSLRVVVRKPVNSAILSTLSIIIRKGGMALKPFLTQLQTTFIKCLQDNTRTVRSGAALALGKLSALSTRVVPLVGDLLSRLQTSDAGIREAILTALRGVLKHAGKSVSSAVRTHVYDVPNDLIHHDDDQVRISVASILGIMSQVLYSYTLELFVDLCLYNDNQYMEDAQLPDLLSELLNLTCSPGWAFRHGSVLMFSALLKHNPFAVFVSSVFSSICESLKSSLKDEKFPIREGSTKAFGRLLLHQIKSNPSNNTAVVNFLSSVVSALHDDCSEVRRRALSALKSVANANPAAVIAHVTIFGPALAECLKDGSAPVRLAAERCALHAFRLTRGTEYVQGAKKFITGLDARRLAKYPEDRYVIYNSFMVMTVKTVKMTQLVVENS